VLLYLFIFLFGGPKLLQLQNLGVFFLFFFLGGQNRNFEKVRGLKLQLSLFIKDNFVKQLTISLFHTILTTFLNMCEMPKTSYNLGRRE